MATPTNITDHQEANIIPLYESIQYYQKIASSAATVVGGGRKKVVRKRNIKKKTH
jgi:hypothetical protein